MQAIDGSIAVNPRYFMQSLAKGLKVLEVIADSDLPLNLTAISRKTGFNIVTTTRCCHTLQVLDLIYRDGHRRFNVTPKVLKFGYAKISRLGWVETARHRMEALAKNIGETINLSILDGDELLYVARIKTPTAPYDIYIGSKLPLHCTAMGKVLLAFSPPQKAKEAIDRLDFRPLTHRTITKKADYISELEQVRQKGYAINDEELSTGLRSVAAPVLDNKGCVVAALNVAVPIQRYSRNRLEMEIAPQAVEFAQKISRDIQSIEE